MPMIVNGGGTRRKSTYNTEGANKASLGRARSAASRSRGRGPAGPRPGRSYRPGGGRATGFATGRARGVGGGLGGGRAANRGAGPKYAGPPPPSAAMIQQLYEQLGDLDLRGKNLQGDYSLRTGQLGSARELFLKQLADTYRQRQESTAADYAARGLSQSGLYNEALADLGRGQAQEQGAYEADYQGMLAQLLQELTSGQADIRRQRSAIQDRYERARGDRARILSLMG